MTSPTNGTVVFWHRELPPLDAEVMGEYIVEASSERVQGTLTHGGRLWDRCYGSLMAATRSRLEQEVARLGGSYAHALNESIDSRRDDVTGEVWLYGRFSYVLSRKPL